MASLSGFNAENHEEATEKQDFEPLPEGEYVVIIQSSEMKPCKDSQKGSYLDITLEVIDGEYAGRKLFDKLGIGFTDFTPGLTKGRQMAEKVLGNICRAVGVMKPNDSAELHGKPLSAKVVCKKSGDYVNNDITLYGPAHAAPVGAPSSIPPQTTGYASTAEPSQPAWK